MKNKNKYKINLKHIESNSFFSEDGNLIFKAGNKNYDLEFLSQFDYDFDVKCDYYVLPIYLKYKINYKDDFNKFLLSYFSSIDNNEKNIFVFQRGDNPFVSDCLKNFFVLKHSCLRQNSCYCIPYNVDYRVNNYKNITESKLEVSFVGTFDSHESRKFIPSILGEIKANTFFKKTEFYCNIKDKNLKDKMMIEYNHILNDSVFILCPPGHAPNSIRFFEAMKIGRIPILFNKDAKLPFDWLIDYDSFVLYYDKNKSLNDQIEEYKNKHDLKDASFKIKKYYDEILFWNPYKFINLIIDYINL